MSFALLVVLAITTAATRASNLDLRCRLEQIEFGRLICAIEHARRAQDIQPVVVPAELARRYHALRQLELQLRQAGLH